MFVYRPPKGSCWGHSLGKDQITAIPKLDAFFDAFCERVEQQSSLGRDGFSRTLAWKASALPKIEWPEAFQGPENENVWHFLFCVIGNRVSFPMGILFPLSTTEPASFEFLRRFCSEAPFQISAKYFRVGVIGKSGNFAWRKPDTEIAARLEEIAG